MKNLKLDSSAIITWLIILLIILFIVIAIVFAIIWRQTSPDYSKPTGLSATVSAILLGKNPTLTAVAPTRGISPTEPAEEGAESVQFHNEEENEEENATFKTASPEAIPSPIVVLTPTICAGAPSDWIGYTLQLGDTLSQLALDLRTSERQLMDANCLKDSIIYAGELLYVPEIPPSPTAVSARATQSVEVLANAGGTLQATPTLIHTPTPIIANTPTPVMTDTPQAPLTDDSPPASIPQLPDDQDVSNFPGRISLLLIVLLIIELAIGIAIGWLYLNSRNRDSTRQLS